MIMPTLKHIAEQNYILAVEDSPVQSKKLKRFLDGNQIRSKIFNNAIDALRAAEEEKPILIISDIIMEGMDGYEFCSQIKTSDELKDIPVILLTSLSDPLDIIKGLQAGADNFITKPYHEDYLLSRINHMIFDRKQQESNEGPIHLVIQDQKYLIRSDKKQILDLLLSVYEAAVLRNNELIKVQQQLYSSNQKLLAVNQELDAFARTVSHDLRSPLTGVIGFAQILIEENEKTLNEESLNYLQWIIESADKMSMLINDLLQYSLSGLTSIEPVQVDLTKIARDILSNLQRNHPDRKVEIEIQENMIITADPKLMDIALINLLENAWKYSVKTEKAVIRFYQSEPGINPVFCVQDNGCGFDMNTAEGLFSPFVRIYTEKDIKGTGVGLSTVKKIMDKHKGLIWAKSEPGKGSSFFFQFSGQIQ